jgi:hypothetical protein
MFVKTNLAFEQFAGFIELGTEADAESIREIDEVNSQFDLLTVRLNVLLGNTLVN